MATRNDVTGDELRSKTTSKDYATNYDAIFRKPKETQSVNTCPCGGAPCRYCWCPDETQVASPEAPSDKPKEPT